MYKLTEWLVSFTTFPLSDRMMDFLELWEPYLSILLTQKQAYFDCSIAGTWDVSSSMIAARKSGVPIFSSHWTTRDKSWEYTTCGKKLVLNFVTYFSPVAILIVTSYKCESTQHVANITPDCWSTVFLTWYKNMGIVHVLLTTLITLTQNVSCDEQQCSVCC